MGTTCHPCTGAEDEFDLQINQNFLNDCLSKSTIVQAVGNKEEIKRALIQTGVYFIQGSRKGIIYRPKKGFYQGEVHNGKAQGYGKFTFLNSNQFQGSFQDDQFHRGILTDKSSQSKFQGTWENNFPLKGQLQKLNCQDPPILLTKIKKINNKTFFAAVKMPNKLQYQGEFVMKYNRYFVYQGKGVMKFPDGARYQGDWFDGRLQGQGKYIWANGDQYQGGYENGQRSGWGKMYWKKQNKIFKGSWLKGIPIETSIIESSQSSKSLSNPNPNPIPNKQHIQQSQNISGQFFQSPLSRQPSQT